MRSKLNKRTNQLLLTASAMAVCGGARALYAQTPVSTTAFNTAEIEPGGPFTSASGFGSLFVDLSGSGASFPTWVAMDFNSSNFGLTPGTSVTDAGSTITVGYYNSNFASSDPSPVTLNYFLATDTSTSINPGSSLNYDKTSSVTYAGQGLANPGMTGSFAAGTFLYPLGSATVTPNSAQDTLFSESLSLSPAADTYLTNQANLGGDVRIVITTTSTNALSAGIQGYASSLTGNSPGSGAPFINLSLTTSAAGNDNSTLYLNTLGTKSLSMSFGRALAGATLKQTYTLGNSGTDPATYHVVPSNADASTGGAVNPLTGSGGANPTTTVTAGFNGVDTAAVGSIVGTVSFTNFSNANDSTPATVSLSATIVARRLLSSGGSGGSGQLPADNLGKVLVNTSKTVGESLRTTNTNTPDDSHTYLNDLTLKAGAPAELGSTGAGGLMNAFSVREPFSSSNVGGIVNVANVFGSVPAGSDQLVNNQTGVGGVTANVNAGVQVLLSGIYGDGATDTRHIGTITRSYTAGFIQFQNTTTGTETVVHGEGLQGESNGSDNAQVFVQWSGYQAASVSGNAGPTDSGGTVTLTNAVTSDNIITTATQGSANEGLRGAAYVSANPTFNQGGWSQTGFTPVVLNPDGTAQTGGTVIAGSSAVGDAVAHSQATTISFNETNKINGTYGATMTTPLENEQDISGTALNDLAPAVSALSHTVTSNPSVESGNYTLDGGTLSAPATNLTGSFTQTGGTSVFNGITGTGTVTVNGGTMQLATSSGLTTVNSLSIGQNGALDITNNHIIINYGSSVNDPVASIASLLAKGYNGGTWTGAGGIFSSAVASNPGYGIGYADSADPGNPAMLASGTMEIAFTLLGDVDLNGVVNGVDFGILAANFNKGVTGWDKGDFDYNGVVNGIDFGALAANFNKGASASSGGATAADWQALDQFAAANGLLADVPEPASIGLLAAGAAALMIRRRKRA